MGIFFNLLNQMPASWIRGAGALRGRSHWLKYMTDWLPAMLRDREGRIQRGLGRGLRFHGAHSAVGFVLGTHDPEVQNALARFLTPGMTTYDIGANVGFTALLAARQVAPNGKVFCFEPLAANADQIVRNAARNGFPFIHVLRIALGSEDGEAEFLISQSPTWGRLAQAGATPLECGTVRVPVRSLDSLVFGDNLPPPQFIKMDVEGAEGPVLIGAKRVLSSHRPLMVIELHHTYDAVVNALHGQDYLLRPLVARGKLAATSGEYQTLAVPRERRDIDVLLTALVKDNGAS